MINSTITIFPSIFSITRFFFVVSLVFLQKQKKKKKTECSFGKNIVMTNDEQAFWLYTSKKTKTYLLVICSFIKNFDKLCTR